MAADKDVLVPVQVILDNYRMDVTSDDDGTPLLRLVCNRSLGKMWGWPLPCFTATVRPDFPGEVITLGSLVNVAAEHEANYHMNEGD